MKEEGQERPKPADLQEKGRSDSEVPMAASEEDVKLSEIARPEPVPASNWVSRLCSCFPPARSNSAAHKAALLPPQVPPLLGKATLILDLDETLVHASFTPGTAGDLVFQLNIERQTFTVSVLFRPGAQAFLSKVAKLYEVVIFTASLNVYADRVIDALDVRRVVTSRLFRDSCTLMDGSFVKDLSRLGRDLRRVVILDVHFT